MKLIDIHNVSRRFGQVQALAGVHLSVDPGTIGLVGNNGAGKSTLLKILLGLLEPDSGSGTLLGCELREAGRVLRGRMGYMPESAALVPVLRGVEFVTLSGDLYGMPHAAARRRAHEVLNYVGLGELRYRRLEEYSTGNLQRLKLAAALVHDPQLLLLDEPTNGLDPQGRVDMLRLLEDLIAETGKSVILCTHLLGDVERLCDQVVVLHRGTVMRAGTMAELRARYGNRMELSWQGDSAGFLAVLAGAGIECQVPEPEVQRVAAEVGAEGHGASGNGASVRYRAEGRAVVHLPVGSAPGKLFELAARAGVVLTKMKPEEENLERLFFRVTDAQGEGVVATGGAGALLGAGEHGDGH